MPPAYAVYLLSDIQGGSGHDGGMLTDCGGRSRIGRSSSFRRHDPRPGGYRSPLLAPARGFLSSPRSADAVLRTSPASPRLPICEISGSPFDVP